MTHNFKKLTLILALTYAFAALSACTDPSQSHSDNASSSNTPSSNTPSSNTPSSNTPSSNTPSSNTPSSNTPSGNTSSGNAPSGNTPSGNAPSGNAPSGNAPSGNAPSGNAPSGNGLSDKPMTIGNPAVDGQWHLSQLICYDGSTFNYAPFKPEYYHAIHITGNTGELVVKREALSWEGPSVPRAPGEDISTTITWPFHIKTEYGLSFGINGTRTYFTQNSSLDGEIREIPVSIYNHWHNLVSGSYSINTDATQFDINLSSGAFMFTGVRGARDIELIDLVFSSAYAQSNALVFSEKLDGFITSCFHSLDTIRIQTALTIRLVR